MTRNVQYVSLNEAAVLEPSLAPGTTEIWYQKPEFFGQIDFRRTGREALVPFDPSHLNNTHIKLGSIVEEDVDIIFGMLQGENWSPDGNARTLIQCLGLGHTSMSCGDCVKIGNTVVACLPRGWTGFDVP